MLKAVMSVIVKVCLSDFKAKWTTGSPQHRAKAAPHTQRYTNTHTHNLSHNLHILPPTVSRSPFAECTQQIVSMSVFVQSFLTTGCHSKEQTVEYTYTFLIYSPPDSTSHFCFSAFFFSLPTPSFSFIFTRLHLLSLINTKDCLTFCSEKC